ncbi:hypothetical protein ABZW18_31515 [Streptomyces sp. NPDC004647]|uniref:hypothetical protein n=1 Tax=Streptomyces sp. NPDC004647 TaxID=3154671 RepID=UPI0033A8BBE7
MEPPELPTPDAEPGEIYLLGGQLMFMPGLPSIRCVIRNQSGARCVTKLPSFTPWRQSLLGLPTGSGLLWVRATQVPDHLADQYAAQHCTRHHTAATPLADDISPQWEVFDPQRHPGAHALSLPRGRWTALPFDDGPAFGT